ncbi:MAG: sodium:solute symporter [Candidatus Eisenbacteria bacterium]
MAPLDWTILVVVLGVMVAGVLISRAHMRSVADFLAAGRTAGRYAISVAAGIAGLGAITIVGLLEMNYIAGFSMTWWGFTMSVVILILTVSGWVIYRFRQTRSLTLPEFFERRYSRNFRVFGGMIAFLSGLINFGIFPAVGARFFIHYCGIPDALPLLGLAVPAFPLVMAALLGLALFFVFQGGQVAVLITDFAQGLFVNVVFIVIVIYLYTQVDWSQIMSALASAPTEASLINPFKTSHVEDFNFWYFLIGVVGVIYGALSWQGTQAYNTSAKSAHEAKMAGVLGNWKGFPQGLFVLFVPIIIYTVMHHPDFAGVAAAVEGVVSGAETEAIRSQLRGPIVLTHLLPVGLLGAFAAVMLAAFISTHDTYLHSWGSIFIQDVVMPLRKERLTQKQHLLLLRLSIVGVAVFIFFFSLLFKQSQHIFLFFAITGAIFAGGSGAVIIGGLYWKRGTAPAAWTALIAGSTIAVGGILIHQTPAEVFHAAPVALDGAARALWLVRHFLYNVNGQQYWAIAMGASSLLYVLVSLLGPRRVADLDRLLHRGEHDEAREVQVVGERPSRGWRALGVGREFTRGDRIIYVATYVHIGVWFIIFIAGTVYNLRNQVADETWARFWRNYFYIQVAYSIFVVVWFAIGGFRDIGSMLRRLRTMRRDEADDGTVASLDEGERE